MPSVVPTISNPRTGQTSPVAGLLPSATARPAGLSVPFQYHLAAISAASGHPTVATAGTTKVAAIAVKTSVTGTDDDTDTEATDDPRDAARSEPAAPAQDMAGAVLTMFQGLVASPATAAQPAAPDAATAAADVAAPRQSKPAGTPLAAMVDAPLSGDTSDTAAAFAPTTTGDAPLPALALAMADDTGTATNAASKAILPTGNPIDALIALATGQTTASPASPASQAVQSSQSSQAIGPAGPIAGQAVPLAGPASAANRPDAAVAALRSAQASTSTSVTTSTTAAVAPATVGSPQPQTQQTAVRPQAAPVTPAPALTADEIALRTVNATSAAQVKQLATAKAAKAATGSTLPTAASPTAATPAAAVVAAKATTATAQMATAAAGTLLGATVQGLNGPSGADAQTPPGQAASDVAQAALQQATASPPLSRMAEMRSRLHAAQIGANGVAKTAPAAATPTLTPAAAPTVATDKTVDPLLQLGKVNPDIKTAALAQALAKDAGSPDAPHAKAALPIDPPLLPGPTLADLSQSVDPRFASLMQTDSPDVQSKALASSNAIPLSAFAGALVSHAKAGSTEFTVRLDPADLGRIDVKMKVSADGEVRAHMIVERKDTLDLLTRDQRGLQQTLDQAGFKSESSGLQFSLRDQSQGQGQQGQQQTWRGAQQGSVPQAQQDQAPGALEQAAYARQTTVRPDGVDLSV